MIWLLPYPPPPSRQQVVSLRAPVELTNKKRGWGWGRSSIIRERYSKVIYKSFNTLYPTLQLFHQMASPSFLFFHTSPLLSLIFHLSFFDIFVDYLPSDVMLSLFSTLSCLGSRLSSSFTFLLMFFTNCISCKWPSPLCSLDFSRRHFSSLV
jgi:hypothetical protein